MRNGQKKTVSVILKEELNKEVANANSENGQQSAGNNALHGVAVTDLNSDTRSELNIPANAFPKIKGLSLMNLLVDNDILKSMKSSMMISDVNTNTLQIKLTKIVEQSMQPLSASAQCRLALRALITEAVNRMVLEQRLADDDVALACTNLKRFVHEMKIESVFLGHAEQLKYNSFRAARERMEKHAVVTPFTLWPFWPCEYVVGNKRQK